MMDCVESFHIRKLWSALSFGISIQPEWTSYSYGRLPVISTYNPIYRLYNRMEITSYN